MKAMGATNARKHGLERLHNFTDCVDVVDIAEDYSSSSSVDLKKEEFLSL